MGRKRNRFPETTYMRGHRHTDVRVEQPNGSVRRVRVRPTVNSARAAWELAQRLKQATGTSGSSTSTPSTERATRAAVSRRREVPTYRRFAREFLRTYAVTNNARSEVESKERLLRLHIVPVVGHLRVDAIGAREVEEIKARALRKGLSRKTVNNIVTVVRKSLDVAVEWELIEHLPRIKFLEKVPKPEIDFLDFFEAERLVLTAQEEGHDAHVAVLLGLHAGLRRGEMLGLRWDDVDLRARRLVVRRSVYKGKDKPPKSGKPREVPLTEPLRQALSAFTQSRFAGGWMIPGREHRHRTRDSFKHVLRRVRKRAGLRHFGWHALRHTFASHLVMRGVPLRTVQELLGHSSIEMTMRYAHLAPAATRAAVDVLAEPAPEWADSEQATDEKKP